MKDEKYILYVQTSNTAVRQCSLLKDLVLDAAVSMWL